ncbi:circadian-associated transcriptional repressor isoform X2 [Hemicordylus capensis]|uniref:circadian-associated transcriptional repressor isoform X2 n=1 Tax=Hemicordylus capensis TaxID=884348 RepID=UPI0023030A3F|nr:circadian-associated transcriptional repressor isoform X2 [Hemicordylus capensis]
MDSFAYLFGGGGGQRCELSRATMEPAKSVSSCESLYSVESTASEDEEEERGSDFEVFLSDSGSEAEKEAGPLRGRRGAYPAGQNFFFSPQSGRTHPGLRCRDRTGRARKPHDLLPPSGLRPSAHCCRYPMPLAEPYCRRLEETGGSLPWKSGSQKGAENSGRKRLSSAMGGGRSHGYPPPPPPSLREIKRQRKKEVEAKDVPRSSCWTAGDQLFAQKCWELQGFVRPLMGLLNRLKMGRFDRGLSSFQQSVAMDRIQRIIGVLQKPEMGERYLDTLLQVERMLKVWFPQVALKNLCANCDPTTEMPCQTVKPQQPPTEEHVAGRRGAASRDSVQSPPTEELHQTHLTAPGVSDGKGGALWGEPVRFLTDWPAMNLTWIHTSPISNPPLGHMDLSRVNSAFGQALLGPNAGAYGVVVFLQNNPAAPIAFGPSASMTPVPGSPTCCHSSSPLPGSGEPPRPQSLPGATVVGEGLLRGTLHGHSRSLPHLPTSEHSEGWDATSRKSAYYCDS